MSHAGGHAWVTMALKYGNILFSVFSIVRDVMFCLLFKDKTHLSNYKKQNQDPPKKTLKLFIFIPTSL